MEIASRKIKFNRGCLSFVANCLLTVLLIFGAVFFPITAEAFSAGPTKIYGFFDLKYKQSNNDQGNENGSFDNNHFNLLMDFPVSDKLMIKSHIEFEHGVDTGKNFGQVKVEWAFLEYSFRDELNLRGGVFFSPFGIYNELRDSTPAFLSDRVPDSLYDAGKRGGFNFVAENSTGINILGRKFFKSGWEADYNLYISNGENTKSTNPAEFDDNTNKAVGGRVNLYPNDSFNFGFSFFLGDKAISPDQDRAHTTLSASLELHSGLFDLISEGAYSGLNGTEQYAGYAQLSKAFGRFTPYYRYEYLDPNISVVDDTWETHIVGLNFNLTTGLYLKTEINLHDRGGKNRLVTNGQTRFREYKVVVVVAF